MTKTWGAWRHYSPGYLCANDAEIDEGIICQILSISGFEDVGEFNNSLSSCARGELPDDLQLRLKDIFSDPIYEIEDVPDYFVIGSGVVSSLQESLQLQSPFRLAQGNEPLEVEIYAMHIEREESAYSVGLRAAISSAKVFEPKREDLEAVCSILIEKLASSNAEELNDLDKDCLRAYLHDNSADPDLVDDDEFIEELGMQVRWMIESFGLATIPLMDDTGRSIEFCIDGDEEVGFTLVADDSDAADLALAYDPDTPLSILSQMVNHKNIEVRLALSLNCNSSTDILVALSWDNDASIRESAALDERLPSEALRRLAKDIIPEVRCAVASCTWAPVDILEILALDEAAVVRAGVAENPSSLPQTLKALPADKDSVVRCALIRNQSFMTDDLFVFFAKDPDPTVRLQICDYVLPIEAISILLRDKEAGVRSLAIRQQEIPSEILDDLAVDNHDEVRAAVASSHYSSSKLLIALADDSSQNVRSAIGSNPNTPLSLLLKLSQDNDEEVRIGVASNTNAPSDLIARLCSSDPSRRVRSVAEETLEYIDHF